MMIGEKIVTTSVVYTNSGSVPVGSIGIIVEIIGQLYDLDFLGLGESLACKADSFELYRESQIPAEQLEKPERYNKGKIEVWDFILDQGLGFLDGNIIKYICRRDKKGKVEDLKKARIYLDKLIAEEEK